MNTPNKLTLLRMFLVLPFVVMMSVVARYTLVDNQRADFNNMNSVPAILFLISALVFVIAMFTDFLDGYLARKNNQVTTFGKLFDPLADKLMTTTALLFLAILQICPFWVVLIFILRDICVDGFRNLAASKNHVVAASIYGKAKTMVQSIAIPVLMFIYPIFTTQFGSILLGDESWKLLLLNIPVIISVGLSILSGTLYLKQIIPLINN